MAVTRRVFINDLTIGAVQRKVLAHTVRRATGIGVDVVFASALRLTRVKKWQVKPEVTATLAAKLAVLCGAAGDGLTFYLDGNCMVQGDLGQLFDSAGEEFVRTEPDRRIGRLTCFLVNPGASVRKTATAAVKSLYQASYDDAADFELDGLGLPEAWVPVPYGASHAARIIDCTALQNRPWYSPYARGGEIWVRQVDAAVRDGVLGEEDIETDLREGRVRPSLGYQLSNGIADPIRLPATIRDLDQLFVPPELALSTWQLKILRKTKFKLPKRKLTKIRLKKAVKRHAWFVVGLPRAVLRRGRRLAGLASYLAKHPGIAYRASRDPVGYLKKLVAFLRSR